jgi:hypothetical protein
MPAQQSFAAAPAYKVQSTTGCAHTAMIKQWSHMSLITKVFRATIDKPNTAIIFPTATE